MLSPAEKERYARQLLLSEVGNAGQERLCAAELTLRADADERALEVAREYLVRAGVRVIDAAVSGSTVEHAFVASHAQTRTLAGDALLHDAAAWLAGSFAAVEAMKRVLHVGTPAALPAAFALASEVR